MKKTNLKISEEELVALLNAINNSNEIPKDEAFADIQKEISEISSIKRLPGEFFKKVPGTLRFYASNYGRVMKLTINGEHLCRLIESKNKTRKIYYEVYLELDDGSHIKTRVSRIIAKTWLDSTLDFKYKNDKRIVDHISNVSTDNRIGNLRILKSQSENIKAAIYEQGKNVGKSIKNCYAYNIKSGEVREYKSTKLLINDIWKSNNAGFFNHALKYNTVSRDGWVVGYDLNLLYERGN